MLDEPERDQQANCEQNCDDRQPIFASPPQRKQEANAQYYTGNFAGDYIKATESEQCAYKA